MSRLLSHAGVEVERERLTELIGLIQNPYLTSRAHARRRRPSHTLRPRLLPSRSRPTSSAAARRRWRRIVGRKGRRLELAERGGAGGPSERDALPPWHDEYMKAATVSDRLRELPGLPHPAADSTRSGSGVGYAPIERLVAREAIPQPPPVSLDRRDLERRWLGHVEAAAVQAPVRRCDDQSPVRSCIHTRDDRR